MSDSGSRAKISIANLFCVFCVFVVSPASAGYERKGSVVDEYIRVLNGKLDCGVRQKTFCTHYSISGVGKTRHFGIEALYLHYNRITSLVSPRFLTLRLGDTDAFDSLVVSPVKVEESCSLGKGRLWYVAPDVMYYELKPRSRMISASAEMFLPASNPPLPRKLRWDPGSRVLVIETRLPRTDKRDPDESFPMTCAARLPSGCGGLSLNGDEKLLDSAWEWSGSGELALRIALPSIRTIGILIAVGVGENAPKATQKLNAIEEMNAKKAESATLSWLKQALGKFSFDGVPENLRPTYAISVYSLTSNAKTPHGLFGKHIACFPNRSSYASHYLWDSCFISLGLSLFNHRIAADGLRILAENQEPDGKIPQFTCATWHRPGESQPPLIGWAAWRLYEKFGDETLLRDLYAPLTRFVEWWLANRDEDKDGLMEYSDAFESGWDDSPRFDDGKIEAVELNSFLYREMMILSKIASLMGKPDESAKWRNNADELGKRILAGLYDREDGIFYDRLFDSHKFVRIQTPASFAPPWCGVPMERDAAKKMIERYLLNPDYLFGPYPFPTVAYNHPKCLSDKWWRGPIWPNMAWMCTEVLRAYGYEKEWRVAAERLVNMIALNGDPHELYDCKTGKPLGAPQLGWSCSVFMQLAHNMNRR